jgi:hypothetical protein
MMYSIAADITSDIFDFQYLPDVGGIFFGEMLLMHLKPTDILGGEADS